MKVNREAETFKPVTIVIESQDELDWLFCCLATTSVRDANKIYADEFGGRIDRFRGFEKDVEMYEAIKELIE
jgi:hypothetical protein